LKSICVYGLRKTPSTDVPHGKGIRSPRRGSIEKRHFRSVFTVPGGILWILARCSLVSSRESSALTGVESLESMRSGLRRNMKYLIEVCVPIGERLHGGADASRTGCLSRVLFIG